MNTLLKLLTWSLALPPSLAAPLQDHELVAARLQAQELLGLSDCSLVRTVVVGPVGEPRIAELEVPGERLILRLWPGSVRAQDFRVLAQREDGSLEEVDAGPDPTVIGEILGYGNSEVHGAVLDARLYLRLSLRGEDYWVEPMPGQSGEDALHVMYRRRDVLERPGECITPLGASTWPPIPPEKAGATGFGLRIAELACDADFEFFKRYGSTKATAERIQAVIGAMNGQYEAEVGIRHLLTAILVRGSAQQPYTSTSPQTLLQQFRVQWLQHHANVKRDVAQLFTGKDLDGNTIGIAEIAAICDYQRSFSLSQSDFNGSFGFATDLSAHELGHNWGAEHCQCPAYTMNPIITGTNRFHPQSAFVIKAYRDAVGCLDFSKGGPDLIVSHLDIAPVLGHGSSYTVSGRIRNTGFVRTSGNLQTGAWLTLDGDPFNGNGDDIPMGGECLFIDLDPGEEQAFSFQSLAVPANAASGPQRFVFCVDTLGGPCGGPSPCSSICEDVETNNTRSKDVIVAAPDAELVALSFPASWIGPDPVPVHVTVRNNGPYTVDIPVNISIGPALAPTLWFPGVKPTETKSGVAWVLPPTPSADCGKAEYWTVLSCTNLAIDFKPSNNCKSGNITVSDPAFDLILNILNDPSTTAQGKVISWKVHVENVGNVASPSGLWFLTGVNCSEGAKQWGCTLGIRNFQIAPLAPGESRTYSVSNYKIPCAAFCNQYQCIKAEINYTKNPTDFCLNGNLDEEPLWINCTFPCF